MIAIIVWIFLVLLPVSAMAACPGGSTCEGFASFVGGLGAAGAPTSADRVPYVQGGSTKYLPPPPAVDVRQFGAVGNGSGDDTTAIQTAIDTDGGVFQIIIPQTGACFIVSTLAAVSNLKMSGGGCLKEINAGEAAILSLGTTDGVTIQNVEFDGNKSNNATGAACITMSSSGATNVSIGPNNSIHDCANDGIQYSGTSISITGNRISSIGATANGNASGVENVSGGSASLVNISHNFVNGANGADLACGFPNCSYVSFVGNTLENAGQGSQAADGITAYANTNDHIVVSGNNIKGGGNHCVHVGGGGISITGNVCDTPSQGGYVVIGTLGYATGTVTMTNGSSSVSGSGTAWTTLGAPFGGDGGELFVNGQDLKIANFNSDTSLTLQAAYVGTSGSASYSMKITMPETGATISGNIAKSTGNYGINLVQISNYSVTGNSINSPATTGILISGGADGSVSGNAVTSASVTCYFISAFGEYAAGTVTATNGSGVITLAGGAFATLPLGAAEVNFRIPGDAQVYTATVTDSTHLALVSPSTYQGAGGSGLSYATSFGAPSAISISGNVADTCGGSTRDGIDLADASLSTVAPNTLINNTGYGFAEIGTSWKNVFSDQSLYGNTLAGLRTEVQVAPAVSACGTGAVISGIDRSGVVTVGSTNPTTSCTLTFAQPIFATTPTCTGFSYTGVPVSTPTAPTGSGVTFVFATDVHSQNFSYICVPYGVVP